MKILHGIWLVAIALAGCATPYGARQCDNGLYCPEGSECSADNTQCIEIGGCGNAVLDGIEECDDGNFNDNDNCLSKTCVRNVCGDGKIDQEGDGVIDALEECDDGNANDEDNCLPTCKVNVCGDGKIDRQAPGIETCDDGDRENNDECYNDCSGGFGCGNGRIDYNPDGTPIEECDDGDRDDTDDCVTRGDMPEYQCKRPRCGDGITASKATYPEECDGGALTSTVPVESAGCNLDCTSSRCGDSKVNKTAGEQCDDGNDDPTDNCLPEMGSPALTCKLATCGDGIEHEGVEQCDGDSQGVHCSAVCMREECGNGLLDPGEDCDDNHDDTDGCARCKYARCGDDFVQTGVEQCDGGNTVPGDGCSAVCLKEECRNGIIDPGEDCDDHNDIATDGCIACRYARCGDGHVEDGVEDCDDPLHPGNNDHCLDSCAFNTCGDGFRDPALEACDDGNKDNETVCPYGVTNCESCNSSCTAKLTLIGPFCGDQTTNGPEICDDGNRVDETACPYGAAHCEPCNATCTAKLDLAGPFCGDGATNGPELCDDRNQSACGTCSGNCREVTSAAATGFLFPAPGSELDGGDGFRIDDGIHPATLFIFANATTEDHTVAIPFLATDDAKAMQAKIVAAINGIVGELLVQASPDVGSLIRLVHQRKTARGNRSIVNDVETPSFGVVGMLGGDGGDCGTGVGCRSDDDCASASCENNKCE